VPPGGYLLSDIYLRKRELVAICEDGTKRKGGNVKLSSTAVRVATEFGDEDGLLIFIVDTLVAVISLLQNEANGELRGKWFLEAGFGPCWGAHDAPLFASLQLAQNWILEQLAKSRPLSSTLRNATADRE
jgi:hypothetical protein